MSWQLASADWNPPEDISLWASRIGTFAFVQDVRRYYIQRERQRRHWNWHNGEWPPSTARNANHTQARTDPCRKSKRPPSREREFIYMQIAPECKKTNDNRRQRRRFQYFMRFSNMQKNNNTKKSVENYGEGHIVYLKCDFKFRMLPKYLKRDAKHLERQFFLTTVWNVNIVDPCQLKLVYDSFFSSRKLKKHRTVHFKILN